MAKAKIEVNDHGPYNISGSFEIVDEEGHTFYTNGDVSLCRCGRSGDKPFCDGTHEEIGFHSEPRAHEHNLMVEV